MVLLTAYAYMYQPWLWHLFRLENQHCMNSKILLFCLTSLLLLFSSCKTQRLGQVSLMPNYEQHIQEWQQQQLSDLLAPNGWLSLIGLYWLKEGQNTCGSDESNQIILPNTVPPFVGEYHLNNGKTTCEITPHQNLIPLSENNCNLSYNSISWKLIKRGENYGVRVRDTLRPQRIRLQAMKYFDTDPNYRVYANWRPAAENESIMMRNVLDMEYAIPIEGQLDFLLKGKKYTLTALDGGPEELFLIFSDETTAELTYGGGRYIYCSRPNEKGITIIDFNKSHNPPCAVTSFATCLLPRPENHLPVEVLAGEKNDGNH